MGNRALPEHRGARFSLSISDSLDKAVIRQLATCRCIAEHHQVLVIGATGTGKTFIACALANQACGRGYRAYYRCASRLSDDLKLARADGTYGRLLGKRARLDVLLIDDWGLAPPQEQERRDLLEILEDRYGTARRSSTSQLPPGQWHDHIGEPTLADAICDRLLHNAHRRSLVALRPRPASTCMPRRSP